MSLTFSLDRYKRELSAHVAGLTTSIERTENINDLQNIRNELHETSRNMRYVSHHLTKLRDWSLKL